MPEFSWQDVATALAMAETERERRVAEGLYRSKLRAHLFGAPGVQAMALGPIREGQAVAWAPGDEPTPWAPSDTTMRVPPPAEGAYADEPQPYPLPRQGSPGPRQGQLRTTEEGIVQAYKGDRWQDVDMAEAYRLARADPNTEPENAGLARGIERLVATHAPTASQPGSTLGQDPTSPGGVDTPPGGNTAESLSAGWTVCGHTTTDGPCTLRKGHPEVSLPGTENGHMHVGEQE